MGRGCIPVELPI